MKELMYQLGDHVSDIIDRAREESIHWEVLASIVVASEIEGAVTGEEADRIAGVLVRVFA